MGSLDAYKTRDYKLKFTSPKWYYITFGLCRYVQKRVAIQSEELSIDKIRSELIDVQYSILRDEKTGCTYRLPSKMTVEVRKLYSIFNLKRGRYLTRDM